MRFHPQYAGLENLYRKYRDQGPHRARLSCNQFGSQEPGDESGIKTFCETNFGVTFPLFAKIDVNGPRADPLYKFLADAQPGILGTTGIKWNFTKFLVDRSGHPVKRYAPRDKPEALAADLQRALTPS